VANVVRADTPTAAAQLVLAVLMRHGALFKNCGPCMNLLYFVCSTTLLTVK
jgi:hypothetical protein